MRPVDADKMLNDITAAKERSGMGAIVAGTLRRYVMRQPTITPQNEPLTIEQLLGMNSTPLWIVDTTINRSEWCYWKNGRAYSCEDYPEHYEPDDYGKWIAYRRPPERQGGDADHA